jgi:hypothetical protein
MRAGSKYNLPPERSELGEERESGRAKSLENDE